MFKCTNIKYIHVDAKQISRTFSSHKTETFMPIKHSSSSPQVLVTIIQLLISLNLITLDPS